MPARLPPETASYQRKTPEPARWVRAPWAKEMENSTVESGKSCCETSMEKPPRPKATWETLELEEKDSRMQLSGAAGATGLGFENQVAAQQAPLYGANQVLFLAGLGHHRFDTEIESVDQR